MSRQEFNLGVCGAWLLTLIACQMETFTHAEQQSQNNIFTRSPKDESDTDIEDPDVEAKGEL